MEIITYKTVENFLLDNEVLLLKKEAVNQLILSNAHMKREAIYSDETFFGKVINDELEAELIFFSTAPYNLLVQMLKNDVNDRAVETLVYYLVKHNKKFRGINATKNICEPFINLYETLTQQSFYLHLAMDIMELTTLNSVALAKGRFRVATLKDLDWITQWNVAFMKEASHDEVSYEVAYPKMKARVSDELVYIFENEVGEPVSIAAIPRKLVNGVSISFVYTKPSQRGKGYGLAVVYQLSQLCLNSGNQFCTLYVDKTNPISNRVYNKIGYCMIEDNFDYRLRREDV